MFLSVDSSVLIAILKGEGPARDWLALLTRLRAEAQLVVCAVVYAELGALFSTKPALEETLEKLAIRFSPTQPESAFLAGQIFAQYRKAGGPRTALVPDFLVGAHALTQTDGLLTSDRGYLRHYFSELKIHQPPVIPSDVSPH